MSDAYQKILEMYESFLGQQKKVADYIMNNIDDAIYFPISRLVQVVEVSPATIVRFAQHLGYQGFNEFRDSLFEYYRDRLSPDNRMKHSIEAMDHGNSIYAKVTNKEIIYLEKSIFTIDESIFCNAVDTINNCRNLYIFAIGANEHLGCYLKFKLRRLKIKCHLFSNSGREMLEDLLLIWKEKL